VVVSAPAETSAAVVVSAPAEFTVVAGALADGALEATIQDVPTAVRDAERVWYADGRLCYLRADGSAAWAGWMDLSLHESAEVSLGDWGDATAFPFVAWTDEAVYAVRTVLSESDDGAAVETTTLLRVSPDGTLQHEAPLPEGLCDFAALDNGDLLVLTESALYWLDTDGNALAETPVDGLGTLVAAADGSWYLAVAGEAAEIDLTGHTVGPAAFTFGGNYTLLTGSGSYDFLLLGPERLLAVSLADQQMTEIFQWNACNIPGEVQAVVCLDEDHWLAVSRDLSMDCWLIGPAEDVPEKVEVVIAIPAGDAAYGLQYNTDDYLLNQILRFNAASETITLTMVSYDGALELQKLLLTESCPDLIVFDSDSSDAEKPSEQVYASRGLLADLTAFLEADPDTGADCILPTIVNAQEQSLGGLYTLPSRFWVFTWYGKTACVGDTQGWTLAEFLDTVDTLPSDMTVFQYATSPDACLSQFLTYGLGSFVDFQSLTAQFDSAEFIRLLEVCKARADGDTSRTVENGGTLLSSVTKLGTLGKFAAQIAELGDDVTLVGVPGAAGSGAILDYSDTVGICTAGAHPAEAWEFFKTLLTDEYQLQNLAWYEPITCSAYAAHRASGTVPDGVTEEALEQAETLILNAATRSYYDSPILPIVLEEAAAFFAGDKTAADTAAIVQDRVQTYLWEQA
jgi:hypothetical protein